MRVFIFCLVFFTAFAAKAQTPKTPLFRLLDGQAPANWEAYKQALTNAPLYLFMKPSVENVLVFDNGMKVSIITLEQLLEMGSMLETGSYSPITDLRNVIFSLEANGQLSWKKQESSPKQEKG